MKTLHITAVTAFAVLMLASGGLLVTHAATPQDWSNGNQNSNNSQALSMAIQGGTISLGDQRYTIAQNGPAVLAVVDGFPLSSPRLTYSLYAYQSGLQTSGSASFQLTGTNVTGETVTVSGSAQISGSMAAYCLPSTTIPKTGVCPSGDTSEVPMYFVGAAMIQVRTSQTGSSDNNGYANGHGYGDGNGQGNGYNQGSGNDNGHNYYQSYDHSPNSAATPVPMLFESAYFNPFGNPITIASTDGSISIVTTYSRATIDWSNVVDMGGITGTVGTTTIAGQFMQVAYEHEDLVAGTANDFGTITLSQMTNMSSGNPIDYLNAKGGYVGSSVIPTAGSTPCGQTCTETGFSDVGHFVLFGSSVQGSTIISGTYQTTWSVPAFGFGSMVSGQVAQITHHP